MVVVCLRLFRRGLTPADKALRARGGDKREPDSRVSYFYARVIKRDDDKEEID
ncbi:hypothetical protein ACLOJK_040548, partial [Asimina triloba]